MADGGINEFQTKANTMLNFFTSNTLKDGLKLIKDNRFPEAINFFTKLIQEKPNLALGYYNIAKCHFALQNYSEAKPNLLKALELNPGDDMIRDILEITNWKMVSPPKYFNGAPSFSRDGKKLVYTSVRKGAEEGLVDPYSNAGIYVYDIATGYETRVVSDEYSNSFPVFSPIGKKLAYLSLRDDAASKAGASKDANPLNPSLYLFDLETGVEKKLLGGEYKIKHPKFFPDGQKIVFCCWRKGDKNSGLFYYDIPKGRLEMIVPSVYEHTYPSVSNQGSKIVFSSWRTDTNHDSSIDLRDNSGIYIRDLNTNLDVMIGTDDYNNSFPSFSPDGNKVGFLSLRNDTNDDGVMDSFDNSGIYIYDLIKKKETCIVNDEYYERFLNFSATGDKIVFLSSRRTPEESHQKKGYFEFKGIYVVDLEKGGKISRILSESFYGSRFLTSSPVENKVAYVSWHHETMRGLYLADIDKLPTPQELREYIETNI